MTDSRASQVLNELMDAFYTQRMIDGDLNSIVRDLTSMKLNEKRAVRLLTGALNNVNEERAKALVDAFKGMYPSIEGVYAELKTSLPAKETEKKQTETLAKASVKRKMKAPSYHDVFEDDENEKYPLVGVELRQIKDLKLTDDFEFRVPDYDTKFAAYAESYSFDDGQYPAMINEHGVVIDGNRRIRLALEEGRSDYMCIVRRVPKEDDCRVLSVMVNLRLLKPSKVDLYYAIAALSDIGLSQQKIAGYVGTSRTNVLVYAKVKDKASAKVRALFEDGLIQVTNASTCADLPENTQDQLAEFIRKYGVAWSKGSKFNELHHAAVQGELTEYIEKVSPTLKEVVSEAAASVNIPAVSESKAVKLDVADARAIHSLKKRIEVFEENMKDAEVWAQRRESVITQQTEDLQQAKDEIELLKRELEASELAKFSSPQVLEEELKKLRQFMDVTERMNCSAQHLNNATKEVKKLVLNRKQHLELEALHESLEKQMNLLRIAIYESKSK